MTSKPVKASDLGVSVGQVFLGKYRVDAVIGQGGMGIVCACTHLKLNEKVAIKMLRPDVLLDHDALERFQREAQAAVKLKSEYVAHVSDVGVFENDVPFMVMEYLEGHDLAHHLDETGTIPVQWATDLMLQAAEALAEAHSIGIIHRDVKPTNLFLTWRPDGSSLVKVLDFGISKSRTGVDMQLTQTQSLLGTPAYMSPEQMRSAKEVDARTDIWSLGTVLYEIVEGHRPFEAESFSEMCVKVAVDPPLPMRNAPPALQQVLLRCLAKSAHERYANMAEVGRALAPFTKNPSHSMMLVERMERVLRRSIPDAVPYPMVDPASKPLPSFGPRAPITEPRAAPASGPVAADDSSTMQQPRRRTGRRIAVISLFGIVVGIGGGVAIAYFRDDDAPASSPAPVAREAHPAPTMAEPAKLIGSDVGSAAKAADATGNGSANVPEPPTNAADATGNGSASVAEPPTKAADATSRNGAAAETGTKPKSKIRHPPGRAKTEPVVPNTEPATTKTEPASTDVKTVPATPPDKAKVPCNPEEDYHGCTRNK